MRRLGVAFLALDLAPVWLALARFVAAFVPAPFDVVRLVGAFVLACLDVVLLFAAFAPARLGALDSGRPALEDA